MRHLLKVLSERCIARADAPYGLSCDRIGRWWALPTLRAYEPESPI